jgi:hypothetical protein
MVRIHFPPALSPLRTSFSGGKRGLKYIRGSNGFRGFESLRLKSRSDEMKFAAAKLARVGRL